MTSAGTSNVNSVTIAVQTAVAVRSVVLGRATCWMR